MGGEIRIAIAGVGNCASSLLQGIYYYKNGLAKEEEKQLGLMHYDLGGYPPGSIKPVAAFDIDARKVGKKLSKAIYERPNCTAKICDVGDAYDDVQVEMGELLDGVADHMKEYAAERTFVVDSHTSSDVEQVLRDSGAEILLNYLPVGSDKAAEHYASCCLATGVSLINCIPVFIASDAEWAKKFTEKGIPVIGDDIKAQVGATIVHRALTRLFMERGARVDRTYQLNTGGNTDFLNMTNRTRLKSKKISKTDAVTSQLDYEIAPENVHIGPADYVPWQDDNKVCFLRMEGRGFAGQELNIELRLSVEDSPNSAGVAIDAIRCCKLARDRGISGVLTSISAYTMKHPLEQFPDSLGRRMVDEFIAGTRER